MPSDITNAMQLSPQRMFIPTLPSALEWDTDIRIPRHGRFAENQLSNSLTRAGRTGCAICDCVHSNEYSSPRAPYNALCASSQSGAAVCPNTSSTGSMPCSDASDGRYVLTDSCCAADRGRSAARIMMNISTLFPISYILLQISEMLNLKMFSCAVFCIIISGI